MLSVGLLVLGGGAWLHRSRSYLIHAQRGDALVNENKTDEGTAELQLAIRQRPDYVPAHFALAHAYFDKGRFSEAESELNRVLELQPKHEGAKYELGMVYLHQQRIPEAKDKFTGLLRVDKDDAYAHLGLGMALAAEENHSAALQEYKTAAQLQPDLSSAFYRIGLEETKLKSYDEAIADFRHQAENWGDDYDTETALADAYQRQRHVARSERGARKSREIEEGEVEAISLPQPESLPERSNAVARSNPSRTPWRWANVLFICRSHENRLSHAANHTEANLVLDAIPHHGPVDSVPHLGDEFMTMPPTRERSFHLYVAKWSFHSNSVIRAIH